VEYVRYVDFDGLAAQAPARATQFLLDHDNGAKTGACIVRCMNVPPGEGSPAGMHIHHFEQIYYILSGVMDMEIAGKLMQAGPNSVVYIPAEVPHKNWNGGKEAVVHLALLTPAPAPGDPISISVP
jgi:mannose-6-phosphate isomerase-like protein (cupin superfamily)